MFSTNSNTNNPFLNNPFAKSMNDMMKSFAPNASGPFGIPTFNPATEKLDKEFSWAFDPQFTLKGMDLSALKNLFPADFMKQWQDMFQGAFQNMSTANMAELTRMPKLGGVDWNALMDSQKKNMEACQAAHHAMLESWQQLGKRQGEIVRECLQTAATLMTGLMESATPEEKLAGQVDIAKKAFDILGTNMRELATLTARGQSEALDVVTCRVQKALDELKDTALKAEATMHASSVNADDAAKKAGMY